MREVHRSVSRQVPYLSDKGPSVGPYGVLMKVYQSISRKVTSLSDKGPPIRTLGIPLLPAGQDCGGQPRDLLTRTALLLTAKYLPPSVHTVVVFPASTDEEMLLRVYKVKSLEGIFDKFDLDGNGSSPACCSASALPSM